MSHEFENLLFNTKSNRSLLRNFDSYIPSSANANICEILLTLIQCKSPSQFPLVTIVAGPAGSGKTHILEAVCYEAGDLDFVFIDGLILSNILQNYYGTEYSTNLLQNLNKAKFIFIDNIEQCLSHEKSKNFFSAIIRCIKNNNTKIIASISSSVSSTDLEILSSFSIILSLQSPDINTRVEILDRHATEYDISLDVLDTLANDNNGNIHELIRSLHLYILTQKQGYNVLTIDDFYSSMAAHNNIPQDSSSKSLSMENNSNTVIEIPPPVPLHDWSNSEVKAEKFKQMLAEAENEEEQGLALQIALSEKLRELKSNNGNPESLSRLETALRLLREGLILEAMRIVSETGV